MAEGVVEAPVAPGGTPGQGGGQGGDGGSGLLPGQGPSSGQPSPGQGQPSPEYVPKSQYDELRSSTDRRYNELSATIKQLQSQLNTRQPAPTHGAQGLGEKATSKMAQLAEKLGLDPNDHGFLREALAEEFGPIAEKSQWLQEQIERQEFYAQYPSFRQYEAKLLEIDQKLESGEMSVMNLKAMAFIGMNTQKLVEDARKAGFEEGAKKEREKLRASGAGGSGARPGATVEDRTKATSDVFKVQNPKFTNKPIDD